MDTLYLCRVCLGNRSLEYVDLEAPFLNGRTYLDCFNECTQLLAKLDDQLPNMLCLDCAQDLQKAYEFITEAHKADEVLRKRLSSNKNVQCESTKGDALLKADIENMEIVVIKSMEDQVEENTLSDDRLEVENSAFIIDDYTYYSENDADLILEIQESDSSSKNETLKCFECQRIFESRTSFENHMNWHKNRCSFKCTKCSKGFRTQKSLERHFNLRHKTTSDAVEDVKLSDENVDTTEEILYDYIADSLVEHYEFESGDVDSMECSKADKTYKLPLLTECLYCKKTLLTRNMEKHLKLHTMKQENYLCAYCPRHFKNQKSVSQHEKTHFEESEDVLYVCLICDRQYSTKYLLEQHRKNTHKEREHVCTICGNAFKLRNQLTNHMKLHLEKNIQCPHCDKKYARQFDLNVHLRSHTGEMPYQCHLCEKRFAIKVRLTYHLQKHYGVKHSCKECGAQFNSKQKLKGHSFKHTGMPYRCELCDDHGFPNRDVFKRHLLRVHDASISEEALLEMFQRNTGKTTRIREISISMDEEIELSQEETDEANDRQSVTITIEKEET